MSSDTSLAYDDWLLDQKTLAMLKTQRVARIANDAASEWWLGGDFDTTLWPPLRAARAKCELAGPYVHPMLDCSCGFCANWEASSLRYLVPPPPLLVNGLVPDILARPRTAYVFGRVAGWGRVMEFEEGWRAEYAYPQSLALICEVCLLTEGMFKPAAQVWHDCASSVALCSRCALQERNDCANEPASEVEVQLLARYGVTREKAF